MFVIAASTSQIADVPLTPPDFIALVGLIITIAFGIVNIASNGISNPGKRRTLAIVGLTGVLVFGFIFSPAIKGALGTLDFILTSALQQSFDSDPGSNPSSESPAQNARSYITLRNYTKGRIRIRIQTPYPKDAEIAPEDDLVLVDWPASQEDKVVYFEGSGRGQESCSASWIVKATTVLDHHPTQDEWGSLRRYSFFPDRGKINLQEGY